MKIALVTPGGVDPSGEYRVIPALLALIRRLSARHETHVFALAQEPRPATWNFEGAHIHNMGGPGTRARAVAAIVSEHRAAPFHVVQSVWAGWPGAVAVAAARLLRLPSIVYIIGGELTAVPDIGYGGRLTWKGRIKEGLVLRGATAMVGNSNPIVEEIAGCGRPARRIPLGVDLAVWPPRAPRSRDGGTLSRLIHVASLNRVKDQTMLLKALAILSATDVPFHIDVVGGDTLAGETQRLAEQLGLASKVTFHGFLTQRQLRPLFEQADINVISSRHEGAPAVVLEAAVIGVPSVGTAVGHFAEWAPDAALAVPVGDAAALAGAIRRLIEDENLRLALAAAAQVKAVAEDADFMAAQFEALYAELAPG